MFLPPGRLQVAIEQECAIGAGTMQVFPDRDTKRFGFSGGSGIFPFVIAAAQVFLQPQIEADEEVPATHLLDFQLGLTRSAVAPGNGNRGPRISRMIVLSGSSTVRLKCAESIGMQPLITVHRYALKAFVCR